jgi:hypothetical protein
MRVAVDVLETKRRLCDAVVRGEAVVVIANETKKCSTCGDVKPIELFHIDRSKKDGRKHQCRVCTNIGKARWRNANREHVNKSKMESYLRNREKYLAYSRSSKRRLATFKWKLETHFGITEQQFDQMLQDQGGCCAICGKGPEEANGHRHKHRLCVDHDHKTGVVRGLLCTTCNSGLGCYRDDPELMANAIEYLLKQKETE